ncbi:MAG: hypothetical protein KAS75_09015 [Planctomycetes bacterium]|nr:hypothetical protein [Planctomycetota bacterium]
MDKAAQNKKITAVGVVFTIIVTLDFLWAANQWFNRYNWPPPLTTEQLRTDGLNTFKNLQIIAQAQEIYKQTDWNKDGKKVYAEYFTHLWTTINANDDPVLIDLISRELSFAVGPYRPKDNYFFVNLHHRVAEDGKISELDYEKQWAILAIPALYTKRGAPIFIIDNSSRIFVKKYGKMVYLYPKDPTGEGWMEVENLQQLKQFQETVTYTKSMTTYPYRYK